jgi:hypothetical protein
MAQGFQCDSELRCEDAKNDGAVSFFWESYVIFRLFKTSRSKGKGEIALLAVRLVRILRKIHRDRSKWQVPAGGLSF